MIKRHEDKTFHVYDGSTHIREATSEEISLFLELEEEREEFRETEKKLISRIDLLKGAIIQLKKIIQNGSEELSEELFNVHSN